MIPDRLSYLGDIVSVNVIVTAIGGENSLSVSIRFEKDVLCHNPDVVTIDMRNDKEKDELIKKLATLHNIGIHDSFGAFMQYIPAGGELTDLLSSINHPNRPGHKMTANELSKRFAAG